MIQQLIRSQALGLAIVLSAPAFATWHSLGEGPITGQQDSTVVSSFSVNRKGDVIAVEIMYEVETSGKDGETDPSNSPVTVLDYLRDHPGTTVLNANGIKGELIKIIAADPLIDPVIEYPSYMKRIFDLVKGRSKKEEAMRIYKEANQDKIVTNTSSTNFKKENGVYLDTGSYKFSFQLTVRSRTTLVVPSFVFLHNNHVFQSKEMVIGLE